jgi:ribosomal protein S8
MMRKCGGFSTSAVLLARVHAPRPEVYQTMLTDRDRALRNDRAKKLAVVAGGGETRTHRAHAAMQAFATDPKDRKRLTELPGVEFESDLSADPLTRIFFQRKGTHSLFRGSYKNPEQSDRDRVELKDRTTQKSRYGYGIQNAVYDFCHRVREASEQRKRFVTVLSTEDTKGLARILYRHGLVAGFRDFHNDRSFVVELKYFQHEPVLNGIEPANYDFEAEMEFSPLMMRSLGHAGGRASGIRIFAVRTWDGRIIDNQEARVEGIGGRGLMMAW